MEVTTRCNLVCTFCSHSSLEKDQKGNMDLDVYRSVIAEGERYGTPATNLNGLGEPMLVRQLPEMLAYAKERGFVDVMFHTNGTIMTEGHARALIESNLDKIIFSVDSPDKATYEQMRIRGKYDRVLSHVRLFAAMREAMGRSTPLIRTTMVVTDKTVHQVPDFVKLWKPLADQITLQDLTWRSKALDTGEWSNSEQSAVPADMDEIRQKSIEHKVSFVCPYLYQSSYTFWNADVIPCSNPNARTHMVMGQIGPRTMHQVWHGKTYRDIRGLHASGKWYEHPVCRDCEVPLIELYKALDKRGVTFESARPDPESAAPRVAEELTPQDDTATDLVTQYKRQLVWPENVAKPVDAVAPRSA
ncbi:MAG TPA: radical SAM protein [Chloroflexota bacterium]|nr:radical SAM protein [Chloroflexota bacterium]